MREFENGGGGINDFSVVVRGFVVRRSSFVVADGNPAHIAALT
jgi:hypothetical protein